MLDRGLLALERPGRIVAATLVALALVALAIRRASLGGYPTYLGKYYAMLAADPFHPAADNPVGHRILAPLISWLVGFRGPTLLYTNLAFVLLLLAVAYLWLRSTGLPPGWSVVGTSTLALSMAALTTLHYGGYPDALTYLLVLSAWWAASRIWLSCALFLLAMQSHESAAFLAPWLLIVLARRRGSDRRAWLVSAAGIGAAIVLFAASRWALERAHPGPAYTFHFYADPLVRDPLHWFRESAPHRLLGIVAAFDLYWVLPIAAAAHLVRRGLGAEAGVLLLPIACAAAQLLLAYDVTRLVTLSFMSVLLGAEVLLRTNAFGARRWIVLLAIANWFIPQLNVAMGVVDRMGPR